MNYKDKKKKSLNILKPYLTHQVFIYDDHKNFSYSFEEQVNLCMEFQVLILDILLCM